jgi:beta-glucoside operon transcriptional antiterminator
MVFFCVDNEPSGKIHAGIGVQLVRKPYETVGGVSMKVLKVINNNVISCMGEDGQEVVVMGRGLGFHSRPRSEVDMNLVEKVFRMDSKDMESLKNMFSRLSEEHIEISHQVIAYATEVLDRNLRENLYLTLTDHLSFAIDQRKVGRTFHNALLTEVKIFYPREYGVGRYALDLIQSKLGIVFPEDEAAGIALHIVNAEYDSSISETVYITQALHEVLEILKNDRELGLDTESIYFAELTIALKFMVMRAFRNDEKKSPEDSRLSVIGEIYPKEYACACNIIKIISEKSKHHIEESDAAYLAIYLHRAVEDRK